MKYLFILFLIFHLPHCQKESQISEKTEPVKAKEETQKLQKTIIFFGDSLTEGLGLFSPEHSYPAVIGEKLKTKGLDYKIINAGLSGDTTSGGLGRLDWVLSKKPDIFVLELGANDMMRGIKPGVVQSNLSQIIKKVKNKFPEVKILLIPMKPFPNLGIVYGNQFESVYKEVSKSENVALSAFLLENVAGIKSLNQKDGIHPTKEGHAIMAENILEDILRLTK